MSARTLCQFVVLFFVSLCSAVLYAKNQKEIVVYDWLAYKNPDIIAQFEKETGIKVIHKTVVNNLDYDSLLEGSENIDVMVVSHYLIEDWIENNKVHKLDLSKLHNYRNLNSSYLSKLNFIPGAKNYVVPYISSILTMGLKKDRALSVFENENAIPKTWGVII